MAQTLSASRRPARRRPRPVSREMAGADDTAALLPSRTMSAPDDTAPLTFDRRSEADIRETRSMPADSTVTISDGLAAQDVPTRSEETASSRIFVNLLLAAALAFLILAVLYLLIA